MQDSVRAYTAADVLREFAERGIRLIRWPPFSPDLNPIEMLWDDMKNWIQEMHGEGRLSYNKLRVVVKAAWEAIPDERLNDLMDSMHDRCQAVIDANGQQTKY